jgi:hypothetical protein
MNQSKNPKSKLTSKILFRAGGNFEKENGNRRVNLVPQIGLVVLRQELSR